MIAGFWRTVVLLMLLAGTSRAQEARRIVGILDVEASPEIASSFEKSLEDQLDTKQYWLVPRAKMRERLRNSTHWSEGCLVGTCLAEAKAQTNAELVVLAALTGSGTSFGYVVTLVRTDTGRIVSQETERCEVCTINEAMTAATLATIRLLNALPERLPDEAAQHSAAVELAVRQSEKHTGDKMKRTRTTGIALTVVGLVTAGIGGALYMTQDKPDYALALTAGGGGLGLGGVMVLSF